jgi:hypothetical protein
MIPTFGLVIAGCVVAFFVGGFLTTFFVNEFFNEIEQHRRRQQQNKKTLFGSGSRDSWVSGQKDRGRTG